MSKNPKTREDIIIKYIKKKKVLDFGCVTNLPLSDPNVGGLHQFLIKYAKKVIGVDYNKKGVAFLKKKGYKMRYGNAETINLKENFDVIVACELIEHLENQGLFLKNCKTHLKKQGFLILSTPNAFAGRRILYKLIFGEVPNNPEHVLWHDEITLKALLKKNDFKIISLNYIPDGVGTFKSKLEQIFFKGGLKPRMITVLQRGNAK